MKRCWSLLDLRIIVTPSFSEGIFTHVNGTYYPILSLSLDRLNLKVWKGNSSNLSTLFKFPWVIEFLIVVAKNSDFLVCYKSKYWRDNKISTSIATAWYKKKKILGTNIIINVKKCNFTEILIRIFFCTSKVVDCGLRFYESWF